MPKSLVESNQKTIQNSTKIFSMCGIKASDHEWARGAHLIHSGSRPEHRIRFILFTGAASYIINKINNSKITSLS